MAINPEAVDHQRLELSCEKVGQVEGAGLGIGEHGKAILASKARIAMRPRKTLDLLLLEHPIQRTAGAAIGIGDKDTAIAAPRLMNRLTNRTGDLFRAVVQRRRQAAQIDMRQPVCGDDRDDLAGQRTASDDECSLQLSMSKLGRKQAALRPLRRLQQPVGSTSHRIAAEATRCLRRSDSRLRLRRRPAAGCACAS